jgi:hypothetical protein
VAGQPAATQPRPWRRRAVAVDGKTLRGSGHYGNPRVHLLAAMDHATHAVLAQTDVDGRTNEIARLRPLLDGLDLTNTVVTADARGCPDRRGTSVAALRVIRRRHPPWSV